MKLDVLLQKKMKKYQTLPFEIKILLTILIYLLSFTFAVFDLIKSGFSRISRTFIQTSNAFLSFAKHIHLPKVSFPSFPSLPSRQKKKGRKRKTIVIFPVTVKQKISYFSFGFIFSFFLIFLPLLSFIFLSELPNPRELSIVQSPQTTKIYDRNRVLLFETYAQQNRTVVSLSSIPMNLQKATIAIEDKNFYTHPGFDVFSMIRAARENAKGETVQGGSTITQQLIKSSLLSPEKSVIRKVKEVILAFWAERLYSKKQILEMYFNQVPYGGTAWGVEAASEVYFGKPVGKLDLAESAFLAGLTSAPSSYSPYGNNPTVWKERQKQVLKNMVNLSFISNKQASDAAFETLTFQPQRIPLYAPHFVMYVKELLAKKYGLATVEKGGLTVVTSLDVKKQQMAQKIVTDEVNSDAYLNLTNGAAVITDPRNGDVLAMIGSKDFNEPTFGKVNLAKSYRQPGSTAKAITYSAALSHGFTAATILDDSRTTFSVAGSEPYSPVNYDGHYFGRVPLRFALANSLNLPAVKTLNQIGVPTMVSLAQKMGVPTWDEPTRYGLSVTLGGAEATMLEMATVFGTLSQDGARTDINPILKITDYKGNVLEEKVNVEKEAVLDPGVAFIMSDILSDNQTRTAAFGPNSVLAIPGHRVPVKTGTSDNKRDNWTIGYTKSFVVTVWVGNNDNSPMNPALASGITGAAPIWNKIVTNLLTNTIDQPPIPPSDVIAKPCLGRTEYFLKGTENSVSCGFNPTQFKKPRQR